MAKQTIPIQGNVFNPDGSGHPQSFTIHVGDTVVWDNKDGAAHNAVNTGNPAFKTPPFGTGPSVEVGPFTEATDATGFMYTCTLHSGMNGTLVVALRGTDLKSFCTVSMTEEAHGSHGKKK